MAAGVPGTGGAERVRSLAGTAAAALRERAGREAVTAWAAPGRVNLIGEHTDYNDGFVLPVAIDRTVVVAAAPRGDGRLCAWSLQQDGELAIDLAAIAPGKVSGWGAYLAGVAWALGQEGVPVPGADLAVHSDLPPGAGLSSSAALACAAAAALAELAGAALPAMALARAARRAEVEVVGMPCGVMDQTIAMLGRPGHALFLDTRTLQAQHVPLDLARSGLRLLVIDTRAPHRLVEGAYAERRAACHEAARLLGVPALRDADLAAVLAAGERLGPTRTRRARHVVTENARVLEAVAILAAGAPERLGPLLAASHASLRDDFEVSCPELDTAVEAATAAGAAGARMTGAGFGGSALALVPEGRVTAVTAAVRAAFREAGFADPAVLPVEVAGGARRVRLGGEPPRPGARPPRGGP